MKPFLKWAGGKRWLYESKQFHIPQYKGTYREPFLGGGASFFEHLPTAAVLSDANARLMDLYVVIRDHWKRLETQLEIHASNHNKEYYYQVRACSENGKIKRAAQFLYLNRTCWNGLYRENRKGEFNVPIGTKQTVIFESDDFGAWSTALKSCELDCMDFETAINKARKGDFLFVDPPYTVRHNMNGFVKYNQNIFTWDDQIRLRDALFRASKRGASFALTNADHESIRELYDGFGEQRQLHRSSAIASQSKHRSSTTELMINF